MKSKVCKPPKKKELIAGGRKKTKPKKFNKKPKSKNGNKRNPKKRPKNS